MSTNMGTLAKVLKDDIRAVTGFNALSVVSLAKDDDGWTGQVEVTELKRVPSTQDLVAVYDVHLDGDGHLTSWERLFSHIKGQPLAYDDSPE
jgi:hypothetical protein